MKNNLLWPIFFILAFSATLFSNDAKQAFEQAYAYGYAKQAYANEDYKESLKYFQQAADKGNKEAYSFIGFQYQSGLGVEQNIDEAIIAYKKGAKLNDCLSMKGLGGLYQDIETLRDYKEAVYWNEKAIQCNKYYTHALISLGYIYYQGGHGVAQNKIKSYKYWKDCASVDESKVFSTSRIPNCKNNLDILCNESPWACK